MESSYKLSSCHGCGKPIVWGITDDDRRIPLDPRAPVYGYSVYIDSKGGDYVRATRHYDAMVSHFATCAHANDFSSSKRKETV